MSDSIIFFCLYEMDLDSMPSPNHYLKLVAKKLEMIKKIILAAL